MRATAAEAGMTPPRAWPVITQPLYNGGNRPEAPNMHPCQIRSKETYSFILYNFIIYITVTLVFTSHVLVTVAYKKRRKSGCKKKKHSSVQGLLEMVHSIKKLGVARYFNEGMACLSIMKHI